MQLPRWIELGEPRSTSPQRFTSSTTLISHAPDGTRIGRDTFAFESHCTPGGDEGDEYTCTSFTVRLGDRPAIGIPALANWTYRFTRRPGERDARGQVFGIDHAKFERVTDAEGQTVPPDKAYHVYNAFIDFHAVCDVFSRPTSSGHGVQDLHELGQSCIHQAAHSTAPVDVGSAVARGSEFRNGEVTLELMGLGVVDDRSCAIVRYDSGESSFSMVVNMTPTAAVSTVGSSHYRGEIYIDLESLWVRKATLIEMVVSETTLPVPGEAPPKIHGIVERQITIRNHTTA